MIEFNLESVSSELIADTLYDGCMSSSQTSKIQYIHERVSSQTWSLK